MRPAGFWPSHRLPMLSGEAPNQTRDERIHGARVRGSGTRRLRPAGSGHEGHVEGCRCFAAFTASDGVDPRFVGGTGSTTTLGDVQARAGGSPERLPAKARVADARILDA